MDEQSRGDADRRLKRIAGQVAGLQRMLAEDRYCVDVLLQVAAVRAALGEVGKVILASHVQTCLTDALRSGGVRERRAKLDEADGSLLALLCAGHGRAGTTKRWMISPRRRADVRFGFKRSRTTGELTHRRPSTRSRGELRLYR